MQRDKIIDNFSEDYSALIWTIKGHRGVISFRVDFQKGESFPVSIAKHTAHPQFPDHEESECEFTGNGVGFCDGSCGAGESLWNTVKNKEPEEQDAEIYKHLEGWYAGL